MLCILLDMIFKQFCGKNQPFLATLYRALFSTAYFGMFRVGELTAGLHAVLVKDVHVGKNKKKLLFLLRTSKTHTKGMPPQMVKISSSTRSNKTLGEHSMNNTLSLPCPFQLLQQYIAARGGYCSDSEQFFIFRDGSPVTPYHMGHCLKATLHLAGFEAKFYGTHSLQVGCSVDLR